MRVTSDIDAERITPGDHKQQKLGARLLWKRPPAGQLVDPAALAAITHPAESLDDWPHARSASIVRQVR
jgi:hypothetical protein